MKETGIIMSGNHPRLILDGLKSQTRRTYGLEEINEHPDAWEWFGFDQAGRFSFRWIGGDRILNVKCPYGGVGDLLWVREAWKYLDRGHSAVAYRASPETYTTGPFVRLGNWKPSIHMFRKDSRIERVITGLRPERLQEISREDVLAEGVSWQDYKQSYDWAFSKLWDSINAKKYPWAGNWWVWVIGW